MSDVAPVSLRVQRAAARVVLAVITAAYAWFVGFLTLRAQPYGSDLANALDRLLGWFAERPATAWITFDLVEFWANVAMFVPFGALTLLWVGVRWWWTAPLLGALASAGIEAAQYLFLDTRFADPRDILANTIGATIGALLMLLLAFLLTPPVRNRGSR